MDIENQLFTAARENNPNRVRELIENGADIFNVFSYH